MGNAQINLAAQARLYLQLHLVQGKAKTFPFFGYTLFPLMVIKAVNTVPFVQPHFKWDFPICLMFYIKQMPTSWRSVAHVLKHGTKKARMISPGLLKILTHKYYYDIFFDIDGWVDVKIRQIKGKLL